MTIHLLMMRVPHTAGADHKDKKDTVADEG